MKLFDPHVHMSSRTTDDYQAMSRAGVRAVLEPSFWVGQPRTHVGSFEDYFSSLVGWERFRASQFGVAHVCALALNPREANDPRVREGVLDLLPRYLSKDAVVAVGEIGYDEMTPAEDECLARQIEMAKRFELPVLIHTPHRDKKKGTRRSLDVVRESGIQPGRVLVDHNMEETLPMVLEAGCWAGQSIYPRTKMDAKRMAALALQYGPERLLLNSAADWGVSDPLAVPKTARVLKDRGVRAEDVERIVWQNPLAFFAQSGRLRVDVGPVDQTRDYEGNSVLRGQEPYVEARA